MPQPKRRFSQRTLTVIIAVTAIAIALLSRLQPPEQKQMPAQEKNITQPPVKQD